ncbi:Protein REVERSION-TO-ETHYLENE SENSITIVITY1-like [Balamuthia mandrillaris]
MEDNQLNPRFVSSATLGTAGGVASTGKTLLSTSSSSDSDEELDAKLPQIDRKRDYFPLCIVWCPLPVLSWICPFIGHLGIVTSKGVIHDFAGPYHVNRSEQSLIFGRATKYYRVQLKDLKALSRIDSKRTKMRKWDATIENASEKYDELMHNLICNNCHSHVAYVLNKLKFKNITSWNTLFLIIFLMFSGRSVSLPRFLKTYVPFVVCLSLVLVPALLVLLL